MKRVVRRIIILGLVFGLLPMLVQGAEVQSEKSGNGGSAAQTADSDEGMMPQTTAGNNFYNIFVQQPVPPPMTPVTGYGMITAMTGPAHPAGAWLRVLYDGLTSYTSIRSYTTNTDYVQRSSPDTFTTSGFTIVQTDRYWDSMPAIANGIRSVWALPGPSAMGTPSPDHLAITQDMTVTGSTFETARVGLITRITNLGSSTVDLGLRNLWDFQINTDDGPSFTIGGTSSTFVNETTFNNPAFSFFRMEDNNSPTSPTFDVNGTVAGFGGTAPDQLMFVCWPSAVNTAFDYAPSGADCASNGGDTAILYYYGPNAGSAIELGPGETATISAFLFATDTSNTTPVAVDDSQNVNFNTPTNINVLTNDFDLDGDPLTITSFTLPSHGGLILNPDQTFAYTPTTGYTGPDSFTYTIEDGRGGVSTATVSITVLPQPNRSPNAVDDSDSTIVATLVNIDVLANDTDPDGDALTITNVSDPPNGTAAINSGTVDYTPDGGFTGVDTFTYTIGDGNGGTDTATVEVTVNPPDNRPPLAIDDSASVQAGNSITIPVLANDADEDGNPLFVIGVGSSVGAASINPDGTIAYTAPVGPAFTDGFTYTLSDGNGGTDIGNVTVNVTEAVVLPPVICGPSDPGYNPEGDLSGMLIDGGTGGVVTNTSSVCAYDVGMASYQMLDNIIDNQILFSSSTGVVNPGQSLTLNVSLPPCAVQVDLFYGQVLFSLNGARYGDRLLASTQMGAPNFRVPAP